jgi:acyl-CoA reductase-like NAD-dependent aldehyde dehydrogenase
VDVTAEMKIFHEEVFGPVLVIHRFVKDEEAVRIVNGTEFGLSGSVFTRDYQRGEQICKQMQVGMSNVNAWGVNYLCQVCKIKHI